MSEKKNLVGISPNLKNNLNVEKVEPEYILLKTHLFIPSLYCCVIIV